jgi:hypothetical protein
MSGSCPNERSMAIQSTGSLSLPQMATMTSPDDACRDSLSSGRPPGALLLLVQEGRRLTRR